MSLIVAIKYKDGILVASDNQATVEDFATHNTPKIFYNRKGENPTVIGAVGFVRDVNLLEIAPDFSDSTGWYLKKDIIENIVPNLFNYLRENNRLTTVDGVEQSKSEFIYCTKDSIFEIDTDGCVSEYPRYCAIGCGADAARGILEALYSNEDRTREEAYQFVSVIFNTVSNINTFVDREITFLEL